MSYTLKDSQTTQNDYWTLGSVISKTYAEASFTPSESFSLTRIEVNLLKIGSPTFDITYYLYSDNAGSPGYVLATGIATLDSSTLTGSYVYYGFNISGYSLISGTKYHHVLKSNTLGDGSNCVQWGCNSSVTGQNINHSQDASTWLPDDTNAQFDYKNYITDGGSSTMNFYFLMED
jgi:hypothetical protein